MKVLTSGTLTASFKHDPHRDEAWLDYIRSLRCTLCGRAGRSQAHHVNLPGTSGMSQKPPDYQAIPMCPECHSRDHTTYSLEEKQLVTEAVAVPIVEYFTRMKSVARILGLEEAF